MVRDNRDSNAIDLSINVPPDQGGSTYLDDDGRLKRTGTVWTASAHIITAVIGSGVLSLAWATAQLGWLAGPVMLLFFSIVTYFNSLLLATSYRAGDQDVGKRNHTYMEAVRAHLGGFQVKACGTVQYLNIFGAAVGYTIASALSMTAITRSYCFNTKGKDSPCIISNSPFMIAFGVLQVILSQIPDFDQIWWLSIVAAVMSFTYSSIGLILGIAKLSENGKIKGSLTGVHVGTGPGEVTQATKIWRSFQALGAIAFAYSFSLVLVEIQDTIKSPPSEYKTMRKATSISIAVTTVFYLSCACFGYAAFGDEAPGNLLAGFGYFNPSWLIDIANAAIIIHLLGAYQVFCQPLFAFFQRTATAWFPGSEFVTKEIPIRIPIQGYEPYKLNLFRLVWRTFFVVVTTVIALALPFFTDIVGILGALGFWPLTVYFPVEMYIVQKRIPKWSTKWIGFQILSVTCLIVSITAAAGSIAGVAAHLKVYKPFKS
ncbi:amino acid permease 3-like [Dorcoceras hygrometricum]|uniref:Amino acid permease 3-like n=1 Tax=Dorcoceras hygrometricum TaxID=472368 RepID=A0A2Z7ACB6_9LAMI|nr:amino acid permease 3-like [Dorcoceras hygrometricum]